MRALRLIAAAATLALAGCGGGEDASDRTTVVAGLYPLAWAAAEVGGEDVDVRNLTPPGSEPHDLELSARDVSRVRDADVVLFLGGGFQPALEDAAAGSTGALDLLEGIELREAAGHEKEQSEEGEEHAEEVDPHVWLDPLRFARIVRRIGATLERPERAAELARRLEALDGEFRRALASCGRREIVVSHAAFSYLADRYRLRQVAIAGVSPEAEPSPRRLREAVERVRATNATTVFLEPLVSPRVAETVARETGASTAVLNPLEGLTKDEVARGDDYLVVMRRNLEALREALECR